MRILQIAIASIVISNCLSFIVFLFVTKRGNLQANVILALLLFAMSLKTSFAFLANIEHNWTMASLLLYYLSESAYLALGPLLFKYYYALFRLKLGTGVNIVLFLPVLAPFIGHFFAYDIPLWYLQLILGGFLVATFFFLQSQTYKKSNTIVLDKFWIKTLYLSLLAIWLVVNLLFIDLNKYFFELLIVFLVVIYFISYQIIKNYWFQKGDIIETVKYKNSSLNEKEENEIIARLQALMANDKVYLDTEITLPKVSQRINVSPHKLSQVINQKLGMTFNEFINSNRINDIKNVILSPEYQSAKISSLAYDFGFNTISAFNTAFKKFTHCTPSEFRNNYSMSNSN